MAICNISQRHACESVAKNVLFYTFPCDPNTRD